MTWLIGMRGAARRRVLQWLGAATLCVGALVVVLLSLRVMTGHPVHLAVWLPVTLVLLPVSRVLAAVLPSPRLAAVVLVNATVAAGLACLVCATYLVIVVGIEGSPRGHERSILAASLVAAAIVALFAVPAGKRLVQLGAQLVGTREPSRTEMVAGFGARLTRAVPMDELMLQLVESLHATIASGGAEIWTGVSGHLALAVSMPRRDAAHMDLGERERMVVGRARIGGPTWTSVWLPDVYADAAQAADHRAVPVAHLGELLGLVVVRRAADGRPYDPDDESALVELARQLGLALHNVRLDSALQASLAELARRNQELQASRLRIVTAADTSRRAIERNLHDGAQQHLVALAVKLGIAHEVAGEGDVDAMRSILADLRGDVQTTIGELRELAHGIYPPLLRERGLAEALNAAAARSPLSCTVDVDLPERYPEAVETAAYFCCLEALQNAGKYAGDGATITISVRGDADALTCTLSDDGVGFDTSRTTPGQGLQNMQDRLGAVGGELTVESAPGRGTCVRATVPVARRSRATRAE